MPKVFSRRLTLIVKLVLVVLAATRRRMPVAFQSAPDTHIRRRQAGGAVDAALERHREAALAPPSADPPTSVGTNRPGVSATTWPAGMCGSRWAMPLWQSMQVFSRLAR
jgi:hypothetical protein